MSITGSFVNSLIGKRKWHFGIFLLVLTLLTLFMMYVYNPICVITDPYFHHNRLLVLMEALQNGEFPFYLDYNAINGYGYFTKAFYSDVFLIPYALIGNITSLNFAYDFYIFSATILSGITMYWLIIKVFKSTFCASIVAVLYTFSAYRIYEIYYHTAVSEVITFIFIPIVFLGLYEIIKGNYKKWYILALGYSAIILTHTITSVLLFITLALFVIAYYKSFLKDKKRILYLFLSGLACLFLCAYYIYPMFEQMLSNVYYYQTKPFIDIKFTSSLLSSIFAGMTNNLPNIGLNNYTPKIGGLLTCLICLRFFIHDKSSYIKVVDFGVIIGLFYIIANTYFFPWTVFPFSKLGFIQFPWRLLKYSTFFFSIAGGFYLCKLLPSSRRKLFFVLFLFIFILFTLKFDSYDYKKMICDVNNATITNQLVAQNAYIGGGEYLPSSMPSKDYPFKRGSIIIDKTNRDTITDYIKNKGSIEFRVNSFSPDQTFELPLTYYKGYQMAYDNDKLAKPVKESGNGLVEIQASRSGNVRVWYAGTVIQKISPYISIISILLLCIYIFVSNKKKKDA